VSDYRAYTIGQDRHITSGVDLDCRDDDAAVEAAKHLVLDGIPIEIGCAGSRVTRLDPSLNGRNHRTAPEGDFTEAANGSKMIAPRGISEN
jgi:hypothetical protein